MILRTVKWGLMVVSLTFARPAWAGIYTTIDVPGATATLAWGINNLGDIVGEFVTPSTYGEGSLLTGGHYRLISYPGAVVTAAWGVNDSLVIAGSILSQKGYEHVFWFAQGKYSNILTYPGAIESQGLNIDNAGTIVGEYTTDTNHGFIRTR